MILESGDDFFVGGNADVWELCLALKNTITFTNHLQIFPPLNFGGRLRARKPHTIRGKSQFNKLLWFRDWERRRSYSSTMSPRHQSNYKLHKLVRICRIIEGRRWQDGGREEWALIKTWPRLTKNLWQMSSPQPLPARPRIKPLRKSRTSQHEAERRYAVARRKTTCRQGDPTSQIIIHGKDEPRLGRVLALSWSRVARFQPTQAWYGETG